MKRMKNGGMLFRTLRRHGYSPEKAKRVVSTTKLHGSKAEVEEAINALDTIGESSLANQLYLETR